MKNDIGVMPVHVDGVVYDHNNDFNMLCYMVCMGDLKLLDQDNVVTLNKTPSERHTPSKENSFDYVITAATARAATVTQPRVFIRANYKSGAYIRRLAERNGSGFGGFLWVVMKWHELYGVPYNVLRG